MKYYFYIFACTLSFAASGAYLTTGPASAEDRPGYTPIPEEFGYFRNNADLQKAVETGDIPYSRRHAWSLFAGMMQPLDAGDPNSWPIWFSWQTSAQAFDAPQAKSSPPIRIRLTPSVAGHMRAKEAGADIKVTTPQPIYPVPTPVIKAYPNAISGTGPKTTIKDGTFFVFNGDIMVATESLSNEGYSAIREGELYLKATLQRAHELGQDITLPARYVSTKHMYWPVKAEGLTPLPWWNDNFPDSFNGYVGYETWNSVVAIDPSGKRIGETARVTYLHGILNHDGMAMKPRTETAKVVGLENFYHHKVSEADWAMFSQADKAMLNAASYWLYNEPFKPGDFLVSVAMHVLTKEVPTWTLQSVWWSDTPDKGPYAADRPADMKAVGPWKHYLLTEANTYKPDASGQLAKAVNPYIEGVIHPIRTNCRNCHVRAGYPFGGKDKPAEGTTGYSNPNCPDLLAALTSKDVCFKGVTLSDFAWIIPDRAH